MNSRGFTLMETLIAMTILMLIIFAFTPLMLTSLRNVDLAWEQRDQRYKEKAEIESELARGMDPEQELEEKTVRFSRGGQYSEREGTVAGYMVESGEVKLFVAQGNASMTISPRRISETAPNNSVEIELYSELLEFKNVNEFSLMGKNDPTKHPGVVFTIDPDDPHRATMKITDTDGITMQKSPYTIAYGSSEYLSAELRVTAASIAAVGENGAYYIYKNGRWIAPYTKGAAALNHAVRTNEYLVLSDSGGSWRYAGDDGWGDTANQGAAGLAYSQSTGLLYSLLNQDGKAYCKEAAFPQAAGDPQLLLSGHTGTAIGVAGDELLWATVNNSGGAAHINGVQMDSSRAVTGLAWNGLTGEHSEVIVALADNYSDSRHDEGGCGIGTKLSDHAWSILTPIANTADPGAQFWSTVKLSRYGFTSAAFGDAVFGSGGQDSYIPAVAVGYHRQHEITYRLWLVSSHKITGNYGIIYYRDASGTWQRADIGTNHGELHDVKYIGGKFYAVGNGGTILVSANGKDWSAAAKASGLTANLRAIAGWGVE